IRGVGLRLRLRVCMPEDLHRDLDDRPRIMTNASAPHVDIQKRVFTLAEFRRAGGPCRARCYELIRAGKLHAVKDDRRTLIPAAEVDRFFAELPRFGA